MAERIDPKRCHRRLDAPNPCAHHRRGQGHQCMRTNMHMRDRCCTIARLMSFARHVQRGSHVGRWLAARKGRRCHDAEPATYTGRVYNLLCPDLILTPEPCGVLERGLTMREPERTGYTPYKWQCFEQCYTTTSQHTTTHTRDTPFPSDRRYTKSHTSSFAPYVGARLQPRTAATPTAIWDLPFVPARYGAQFRGRWLGPRDFSLPLTGVTAH
eukprot:6204517-Prymnesium_polylepis.1